VTNALLTTQQVLRIRARENYEFEEDDTSNRLDVIKSLNDDNTVESDEDIEKEGSTSDVQRPVVEKRSLNRSSTNENNELQTLTSNMRRLKTSSSMAGGKFTCTTE